MNLLKFIPCTQLTIISNKSQDEAVNLLKNHINGKSSFFEGYISSYKFDIHRRFEKFERNSFVPVIKGDISKHPQGTEIKVIMRLHLLVSAFLLVFTFGILRIIFTAVVRHNYIPILFLGIFVPLWLIFWQIYDGEAAQATKFLKRLFS